MSSTPQLHRFILVGSFALATIANAQDGHNPTCGCGGCAGVPESQSPIDIRSSDLRLTSFAALQFAYSAGTNLTLLNNGSPDIESTVLALPDDPGNAVTLAGIRYDLVNVHFHTVSEHRLNGREFDMEMHLVHRDAAGNLLVVGRWIELGNFNAALDPIFSALPGEEGQTAAINAFDLNGLLPDSLASVRYSGSLTTPPFSEGVQWVVLTDVLELGIEQVSAFRTIFPDGNSREPQALNGRTLFTDDASLIPAPATAIAGLAGGLLAVRRRRAA